MRAALVTLSLAATTLTPSAAGVRNVYLNGVDISSARSQDLKGVDLHINETGDIFIIAPHYQVNEEDTYVPLSKYVQGLNAPEHKNPQGLGSQMQVGSTPHPPDSMAPTGEPLSPPAATQQLPAATAGAGPGAAPPPASGAKPGTPVAAPAGGVPGATPPGAAPAADGGGDKAEDPPPPPLPEDGASKGEIPKPGSDPSAKSSMH
jgi:hypothetical protein